MEEITLFIYPYIREDYSHNTHIKENVLSFTFKSENLLKNDFFIYFDDMYAIQREVSNHLKIKKGIFLDLIYNSKMVNIGNDTIIYNVLESIELTFDKKDEYKEWREEFVRIKRKAVAEMFNQ